MFSSSLLSNGVSHTPVPPLFFVTFPPFRATRWYIKLNRLRLTSNKNKILSVHWFFLFAVAIHLIIREINVWKRNKVWIYNSTRQWYKNRETLTIMRETRWCKLIFPLAGNSVWSSSFRNFEFSDGGKLVEIKFDF